MAQPLEQRRALQKNTYNIIHSGVNHRDLAARLLESEVIEYSFYESVTDDHTGKDNSSRLDDIVKNVNHSIDPLSPHIDVFSKFLESLEFAGGLSGKGIARKLKDTYAGNDFFFLLVCVSILLFCYLDLLKEKDSELSEKPGKDGQFVTDMVCI